MARPKVMEGKLIEPGAGRHRCKDCGEELKAGDRIAHTLDMRRMWHSACFEKTLVPLKELQKRATR